MNYYKKELNNNQNFNLGLKNFKWQIIKKKEVDLIF